jgi:hypothetical protein
VTPVVVFETTVSDCVRGIENANDTRAAVAHARDYGCGMLEGYYRAGSVSRVEYQAACDHVRGVAMQRVAMIQLREDARKAGVV